MDIFLSAVRGIEGTGCGGVGFGWILYSGANTALRSGGGIGQTFHPSGEGKDDAFWGMGTLINVFHPAGGGKDGGLGMGKLLKLFLCVGEHRFLSE